MNVMRTSCNSLYSLLVAFVLFKAAKQDLKLTILHTNDVHARIEQNDQYGAPCSTSGHVECYGGVARRYTAVQEIRKRENNVLFLDAGDQFQGTIWFNVYGGKEANHFMNLLGYDAMALGNHEFDNGVSGLLPFLRGLKFPVLAANLDTSREPLWPQNDQLYSKSAVFEFKGIKVGIVGYVIKDTDWLSLPGPNIKFCDEITAVSAEAKRLKQSGIPIVLALGHAGIDIDLDIAESVEDIDAVIGGHTNTFMYTGTPPSIETKFSDYPYMVQSKVVPGKLVPVVQAHTHGKYLGRLELEFFPNNSLARASGNPILLDGTYAQNPRIRGEVEEMGRLVKNFTKKPIGRSLVFLDGRRLTCRLRECNMGNLITDAVVQMSRRQLGDKTWADVSLGVWNGGIIRSSIDKKPDEYLSYADVLTVMPFGNTADIIEIKGKHLRLAFEHSVTKYSKLAPAGRFLQVSGFVITYDISKTEGSRVVSILCRCSECRVPKYEKLEDERTYKVIFPSYIAAGGDDFWMIPKYKMQHYSGDVGSSLVMEYIKLTSPITSGLEMRIKFVESDGDDDDGSYGDETSAMRITSNCSRTRRWLSIYLLILSLGFTLMSSY